MNLIFDMDGTLSDTAVATERAFKATESQTGLAAPGYGAVRRAMGLHGLDFYGALFPGVDEGGLREAARIVDGAEDREIRLIGEGILFPGVGAMLRRLGTEGHSLYIASLGGDAHVEATLTAGGIMGLFGRVMSGGPDKAAMVRDIVGGGGKGRWAVIGDRKVDADAAAANGLTAWGAGFGYLEEGDRRLFASVLGSPEDIFACVRDV
ncbi:MAG: HAD hydrolase-like protein [Oscillospiraceae bacterium]|nr:HAD hydrolase-like protein [Oscillospiraceae bacterium]